MLCEYKHEISESFSFIEAPVYRNVKVFVRAIGGMQNKQMSPKNIEKVFNVWAKETWNRNSLQWRKSQHVVWVYTMQRHDLR